jgi:hypothetical protein
LSEFVPSYAVPSGWRSTSGSRITVGWAGLRKNQMRAGSVPWLSTADTQAAERGSQASEDRPPSAMPW